MAKLKNIDSVFSAEIGESVTIGNNREIEFNGGSVYFGKLHGHKIATFKCLHNGTIEIELDTCGYRTKTTRDAMSDFARVFGANVSVSFAGGEFSARYKQDDTWRDITSKNGKTLRLVASRY